MQEQTKPVMRPYLAAARNFASGKETPRQFLERSLDLLELWEPRIGAFVCTNLPQARAAAERSTERWRAGRPRSPIDGMPVGIKDIIETVDMPTEMGSPLFSGWRSDKDAASVRALRDAGAVIVGKTVTTEFAASEPRGTRNPWNTAHTPGGSSSGSAAAVAAGIVSAALGTQVIGSTIRPASFCGCLGYKPSVNAINREGSHDYQSQSCTGILGATLEDVWQVAHEIVARVGGDAGTPGLQGPDTLPPAQKPRRLAVLETAGWDSASAGARLELGECVARLKSAGIEIRTRHDDDRIAALEADLRNAAELSHRCNGFETRWFFRAMRERDASKLSRSITERAQKYEDMTLAEHRADLKERARVRAAHAALAANYDACIALAAASGAPEGIGFTGNPEFAVPASLLGVPALSLPVFKVGDMPLGLQVIGYFDRDAEAFGCANWLMSALTQGH
jgi:Asp-tRNA(Asn)/Glu-tRNA(Gln) amidotransferase A subunit family amidase